MRRMKKRPEFNDSVKLYWLVFIFLFSCSCTSQARSVQEQTNNSGNFYSGLLADLTDDKVRIFENALLNPNVFIRQAASEQLAVLRNNDTELTSRTAELVRNEAGGWWAAAYDALDDLQDRGKILSFLFSFEQNTYSRYDEPRKYVLNELEKIDFQFSETEAAAIDGHYYVSRLRYNDALAAFRDLRTDDEWPDEMPRIFFDYPNLINDLGRAYQYTSSGREGLALLLQWESALADNASSESGDLRYRLLFFAARVARRIGQNAQALALFEDAMSYTPDSSQKDACIWYILDMSMSGAFNIIAERLEKFLPSAVNGNTYNDVMERYLHRLASSRDWSGIINAYNLIKDINGLSLKAGYAWVIARAMEENYLTSDQRRLASSAADITNAGVSDFMRIAYNAGDTLNMPALYYRMQSASYLGLPLVEFSESPPDSESSDALEFILGFFSNDAAALSVPYFRSIEGSLTPGELRAIASALDEKDMYLQSMRLILLYINNPDYIKTRRDLEIMYPRPFLELIETHGKNFNIAPSLIFGLVRQESAFQRAIVSSAGAVGLMQLMPATAREMADRIRRAGGPNFTGADGRIDSTNPEINVYIGCYYYNYLLNLFGHNDQLSLMAYNGGLGRVRTWRSASSLPVDLLVETVTILETRDYGRRIPALAKIYEDLYYRQ